MAGQGFEDFNGLAISLLRLRKFAELPLNVTHLLTDTAMFKPNRWIVGYPTSELLVILQGSGEKFLLKRVELIVEADIRNFGQHVTCGVRACLPCASASFRLWRPARY